MISVNPESSMPRSLIVIFIYICLLQSIGAQCSIVDFNALKNLYNKTNGDSWTNNTNWNIVADNSTPPEGCNLELLHGINLDENGFVSEINLSNNNLTGEAPTTLPSSLTLIDLSDNAITGDIPSIFYLPNGLTHINYANNQFSGILPSRYSSSVQHLDFSGNGLSGSIPISLADHPLLQTLHLADNDNHGSSGIEGQIPEELGQLINLTSLTLNDNNLSGCYPNQLKNLCAAATTATISVGNNLGNWDTFCSTGKGTCFCDNEDFAILKSLSEATIGSKWIDTTGWQPIIDHATCPEGYDISSAFGISVDENYRVDSISLRDNGLTGELPIHWQELEYTTYINLSRNLLEGSIPVDLGNMQRLKDLRLHQNKRASSTGLSGSIPINATNFDSIEVLSLNQNALTGGVDKDLGSKENLKELWLANNLLGGSIPSELGNLSQLTTLRIEQNGMSGCYPSNLINLCGQLTNFNINGGNNNFDDNWVNFCTAPTYSGTCIDCSETLVSWSGAIDNQWTTPLNWGFGCVPTKDTEVTIAKEEVIISGNAQAAAKDLNITTNFAQLTINAGEELSLGCNPCSSSTLINDGTILNNGTIRIDSSEKTAIFNDNNFTNNGIIIIDTSSSLGISNNGTLENNGDIKVSKTQSTGFSNDAHLVNNGTIELLHIWEDDGFSNFDTFLNMSAGILKIDSVYEKFAEGLKNGSNVDDAYFKNDGNISISNILGEFSDGFGNDDDSNFKNHGSLIITKTSDASFAADGNIENYNIIDISDTPENAITIRNTRNDAARFYNSPSGIINIARSGSSLGSLRIESTMINDGNIYIDTSNLKAIEVRSSGIMINNGEITIDSSGGEGINIDGATLNNFGDIVILRSKDNGMKTFRDGILNNYKDISIDKTSKSGLNIDGSNVFNSGIINITNSAEEGMRLFREGIFTNLNQGEIDISGSIEYGLLISGDSVFNINEDSIFKISSTSETLMQIDKGGILEGYPTIEIID